MESEPGIFIEVPDQMGPGTLEEDLRKGFANPFREFAFPKVRVHRLGASRMPDRIHGHRLEIFGDSEFFCRSGGVESPPWDVRRVPVGVGFDQQGHDRCKKRRIDGPSPVPRRQTSARFFPTPALPGSKARVRMRVAKRSWIGIPDFARLPGTFILLKSAGLPPGGREC